MLLIFKQISFYYIELTLLLHLNNGEDYRPNIFDALCSLYDSGDIKYTEERQSGLKKGIMNLAVAFESNLLLRHL